MKARMGTLLVAALVTAGLVHADAQSKQRAKDVDIHKLRNTIKGALSLQEAIRKAEQEIGGQTIAAEVCVDRQKADMRDDQKSMREALKYHIVLALSDNDLMLVAIDADGKIHRKGREQSLHAALAHLDRLRGDEMRRRHADRMRRAATIVSGEALSEAEVIAADGEEVADVDDLLVRIADGRVLYAALSVGGIAGIGDKLVAVPIDALHTQNVAEGEIETDLDKRTIRTAQGFPEENWPTDVAFDFDVSKYRLAGEVERERDTGARRSRTDQPATRVGDVIDSEVKNMDGDVIGEFADVFIDTKYGCVAFVLIDSDAGLLDFDRDTRWLVPWTKLSQHRDGSLRLTVPKRDLQAAPKWSKRRDMRRMGQADYGWMGTIYKHYDVKPYWKGADAMMKERKEPRAG